MLISGGLYQTQTALHQKEAKASKAVKEVKAHCEASICEAEALYVAAIREVETTHSTSIMDAEDAHMTAVREAEAAGVACTFDLQQAHREPCMPWKVWPSRSKGRLTNPSCGPAE